MSPGGKKKSVPTLLGIMRLKMSMPAGLPVTPPEPSNPTSLLGALPFCHD